MAARAASSAWKSASCLALSTPSDASTSRNALSTSPGFLNFRLIRGTRSRLCAQIASKLTCIVHVQPHVIETERSGCVFTPPARAWAHVAIFALHGPLPSAYHMALFLWLRGCLLDAA
jgi:hypothetical protein